MKQPKRACPKCGGAVQVTKSVTMSKSALGAEKHQSLRGNQGKRQGLSSNRSRGDRAGWESHDDAKPKHGAGRIHRKRHDCSHFYRQGFISGRNQDQISIPSVHYVYWLDFAIISPSTQGVT